MTKNPHRGKVGCCSDCVPLDACLQPAASRKRPPCLTDQLPSATPSHVPSERVDGAYSSSLILIGGLLYCTSEEGKTTVVKPGKGGMKIVATSEIGERTLASLSVGDGAIFHRTESHLYRVGK